MAIHVLQGERELVSDCRSLARFELRGIPPMVAGAARIRVSFEVDADGLLSVTASEASSGVRAQVEVKPSYGLLDSEIERMLRDSMEYAQADLEARRLRERQVEARRVVEALRAALSSDGEELLSSTERAGVEQALHQLEAVLGGDDTAAIEREVAQVEKTCEFYVERRMNRSIHQAMAGHRIEEFE
jgi:molecular chaperone HscA